MLSSHLRFDKDIEDMLGHRPSWYWKIMWAGISPVLLVGILVFYIISYIQGGTPTYQAWNRDLVSLSLFVAANVCTYRGSVGLPPSLGGGDMTLLKYALHLQTGPLNSPLPFLFGNILQLSLHHGNRVCLAGMGRSPIPAEWAESRGRPNSFHRENRPREFLSCYHDCCGFNMNRNQKRACCSDGTGGVCRVSRCRQITRSSVRSLLGCCWCRRSAASPSQLSTPSARREDMEMNRTGRTLWVQSVLRNWAETGLHVSAPKQDIKREGAETLFCSTFSQSLSRCSAGDTRTDVKIRWNVEFLLCFTKICCTISSCTFSIIVFRAKINILYM